MALVFNGSTNTISGLAVGGLPDGSVDRDTLATAAKGSILQVKNTTVTAASQITSSVSAESWHTITPMNVVITPSAATSKILISGQFTGEGNIQDHCFSYRLARTVGGTLTAFGIGDAAGNRARVMAIINEAYYASDQSSTPAVVTIPEYLDTPNTTSEITYHVQIVCTNASSSWLLNRTWGTNDQFNYERSISWLTVQEVAA